MRQASTVRAMMLGLVTTPFRIRSIIPALSLAR